MRQFRGCSRLVYAIETENAQGVVTYGTVKTLAPVKSVNRDIASENEAVYADNTLQQRTYGATSVTRSFDVTRIDPEVVAEICGETVITVGDNKLRSTKPDGSSKPYIAIGYALHDGDVNKPCLIVWAYHCQVTNITQTSNTIDDGTGSEGQTIEVVSNAPKKAWTSTNEKNLDIALTVTDDNASKVDTFFAQVVTPDNASEILGN